MRTEEFSRLMKQITDAFGEKNYAPARLDAIWKISASVETHEFSMAVNAFCENARHPPTPGEFRNALKAALGRARERKQRSLMTSAGDCRACANSGVAFAVERMRPQFEYAYRCFCERGKIIKSSLPEWRGQENMVLIPATSEGIRTIGDWAVVARGNKPDAMPTEEFQRIAYKLLGNATNG